MLQGTLFPPESNWIAPSFESLPLWAGVKRIAIDCETCDPTLRKLGIGVRRNGYLVGVSITLEGSPESFYLPLRHAGGGNMILAGALKYLQEQAASFSGELVGANLQYDLDYLWEEGIFFSKVTYYRDIQVAEPLIDETQISYSLFNIGKKYGIEAKDEELLRKAAEEYGVNPKSEMWKLPAKYVGPYAENDTRSPLAILKCQEIEIQKQQLQDIWNLESKVLPVLVRMRRRGVLIDQNKLAEVVHYSEKESLTALAEVKSLTGVSIAQKDIMKNAALAPALEQIGLKIGLTATGKPNIDKVVLAGCNHRVGDALLWARKVSKLKTTFAASINEHLVNGRIHCTFNQIAREDDNSGDVLGARYGRLSCVKPNLQQQPSRDKFADFWRSIYIPEEGAIWGCNDYSQQEPRWTTHFAALMKLDGAEAAAKKYREDPTTDNHQMMAELTELPRKQAKDIFLGLCYGEGGAKLSIDLGLPTRWAVRFKGKRGIQYFATRGEAIAAKMESSFDGFIWKAAGKEGQEIIDKFNKKAPFIGSLAKTAKSRADKLGQIRTVGGRVCHFPQKKDGSFDWTHKALNRLIQGSSADQVKKAMVAIDSEMPETFLQLQVHDETDGSFASEEEALKVADIMKNCIHNTLVPFKVDTEIGPSWGEIKEV